MDTVDAPLRRKYEKEAESVDIQRFPPLVVFSHAGGHWFEPGGLRKKFLISLEIRNFLVFTSPGPGSCSAACGCLVLQPDVDSVTSQRVHLRPESHPQRGRLASETPASEHHFISGYALRTYSSIRRTASFRFSSELANTRRRYPSPQAPKAEPGTVTTPALTTSSSANS